AFRTSPSAATASSTRSSLGGEPCAPARGPSDRMVSFLVPIDSVSEMEQPAETLRALDAKFGRDPIHVCLVGAAVPNRDDTEAAQFFEAAVDRRDATSEELCQGALSGPARCPPSAKGQETVQDVALQRRQSECGPGDLGE